MSNKMGKPCHASEVEKICDRLTELQQRWRSVQNIMQSLPNEEATLRISSVDHFLDRLEDMSYTSQASVLKQHGRMQRLSPASVNT